MSGAAAARPVMPNDNENQRPNRKTGTANAQSRIKPTKENKHELFARDARHQKRTEEPGGT